jgi:hypothetical protein
VKRVGGVLLGVALLGWILAEVPMARPEPTAAAATWKRTVDGWESAHLWSRGPQVEPARLHPAVLGAFELLASVTALLLFSPSRQVEPKR